MANRARQISVLLAVACMLVGQSRSTPAGLEEEQLKPCLRVVTRAITNTELPNDVKELLRRARELQPNVWALLHETNQKQDEFFKALGGVGVSGCRYFATQLFYLIEEDNGVCLDSTANIISARRNLPADPMDNFEATLICLGLLEFEAVQEKRKDVGDQEHNGEPAVSPMARVTVPAEKTF
jgi:hypothetical protein